MIHVDALDFSECHSEEVISFFWRSVYYTLTQEVNIDQLSEIIQFEHSILVV